MNRSKNEPQPQLRLRGKDGKPYYLKKLPFRKRNPVAFVVIGGFCTFCALYSKPLYDILTGGGEKGPYAGWWPHEIAAGRRQIDVWREKLTKEKAEREAGITFWTKLKQFGDYPAVEVKPVERPSK